jgi:serine/threonine protein kinase
MNHHTAAFVMLLLPARWLRNLLWPSRSHMRMASVTEVSHMLWRAGSKLTIIGLDIRLKNILIGLDEPMDHLSIDTYHEEYGEPHTTPVERKDGLPLTTNVPPLVTRALSIEKDAKKFTLDDARRLVLCDFGEASAPSIKVRIGSESRIPYESRPPEASFEPERPLSYSSDIWSLAVSIWEILGMQFIFRRDHVNRDEIIATQIDVLGWDEVPPAWQEIWKRPEEEDEGDYPLPRVPSDTSEPLPPLDQTFEETVQRFRRRSPKYGIFEEDETAAILTLMRGMLRFDPEKRMTMEEVLRSEWMLKWAMPELRKAMDGSPEDTSQLIWPPFDTRAK